MRRGNREWVPLVGPERNKAIAVITLKTVYSSQPYITVAILHRGAYGI